MFRQVVTDAIQKWQFRTTLLNGQPVEVDTTIAVVFAPGARDEVSIIGAQPAPVPSTVPIEETPVPTSLVLEQIQSLPRGSLFTPIAELDPVPVAHPARIKVPADVQEKNLIHRVFATYPSRACNPGELRQSRTRYLSRVQDVTVLYGISRLATVTHLS